MYVIEISGLKKRFEEGGFCLDLPEMRVPEGYITGFIGENGAGKTTTLKLMMDMLYPDEGTIRILGLDAHLQGPQVRAQIGYVGSTPGYLAHATIQTGTRPSTGGSVTGFRSTGKRNTRISRPENRSSFRFA